MAQALLQLLALCLDLISASSLQMALPMKKSVMKAKTTMKAGFPRVFTDKNFSTGIRSPRVLLRKFVSDEDNPI